VARVSAADLQQLRPQKDSGDSGAVLVLGAAGFIFAISFFLFGSKKEDQK